MPWRQDPTPYKVWISEVMLAQTQVITVIPYFNRFVTRFPDLKTLAAASQEDVNQLWAGLGYYTRARNLLKAAQAAHSHGSLPSTHQGWLDMPGVGPYTAGAICSIALNLPTPLVDGNVERVFSRWFQIKRINDYSKINWSIAGQLIDAAFNLEIAPRTWNQALMELGATVCTPSQPACPICPLKAVCQSYKRNTVTKFPEPKPRKQWVKVSENVDVFWHKSTDSIFLSKDANKWRKELWDFPATLTKKTKKKPVTKFELKLVVTHHKITRTHFLYELRTNRLPQPGQWFKIDELMSKPVAMGAPVKKSLPPLLKAIQK